jgi:arabinose-5-phosphate isomerase
MHYREAIRVFEEQRTALAAVLHQIEPDFDLAVHTLLGCSGKVIVTGVGKSGLIARKIAATFASTGTPSVYLNAADALHGDMGIIDRGDVVLMLSKSGTTVELMRMLPRLKDINVPVIGIFGKTDTTLAHQVNVLLNVSVAKESCPLNLAPTTSTTVSLVVGDALSAALIVAKAVTAEQFALNHPAGQLGKNLLLQVAQVMHANDQLAKMQPEQSVKEAIILLTRLNYGGVCVCGSEGTLLGFVTDGDIRRFLLSSNDLSTPIRTIMTHQPIALKPDMTLSEAMSIMENPQRPIYVAPVVGADGKAVGILRMHDILS